VRRLILIAILLAVALLPATATAAPTRTITLVNATDQTIWPAASPGSTSGQTGWTLKPGAEVSFQVPHDWNSRLWGRTGCHFGSSGGEGGCRTGDCDGRYQCRGWGTIPATLGEFNFDAYKGLDFYDISMVDGSNLPMYATPSGGEAERKVDTEGCLTAKLCTTEVHCPAALRVPRHGGPEVGCISPCARFGTNRYCCRGPFAEGCSPAKTWPVDYAKVFKRAEPYAYSWSGDDPTSVFTCKGSCDYRITFGVTPPTHDAAIGSKPRPAAARAAAAKEPPRVVRDPTPPSTSIEFELPASHGFELSATAQRLESSPAERESSTGKVPVLATVLSVTLARAGEEAVYGPEAKFENGRLTSSLGGLGKVSLRWVPRKVYFRPPGAGCEGGRNRIEVGALIGTLRFEGEHGYTGAVRHRIPATLTHRPPQKCAEEPIRWIDHRGGFSVGGYLFDRPTLSSILFSAERTSPSGAGKFVALTSELHRHMTVGRIVEAKGPAASVAIKSDLSAATVEPAGPFSGTASFVADSGKQTGSWLGDLTVSFPGRPDVPLAGPGFVGLASKPGPCPPEAISCLDVSLPSE
jgi:hypothetical protein